MELSWQKYDSRHGKEEEGGPGDINMFPLSQAKNGSGGGIFEKGRAENILKTICQKIGDIDAACQKSGQLDD
ncbi:MAG: hypothetical protein PHI97_30035 [Desulfobulbus sp.]|nr:hypothetical protein [Desulfobulbus sp.]